jgi:hypothetical protein
MTRLAKRLAKLSIMSGDDIKGNLSDIPGKEPGAAIAVRDESAAAPVVAPANGEQPPSAAA